MLCGLFSREGKSYACSVRFEEICNNLVYSIGVKEAIFALVWGSLNEFTGLFKVFMHEAKGNE